jgi:hypothetical protein
VSRRFKTKAGKKGKGEVPVRASREKRREEKRREEKKRKKKKKPPLQPLAFQVQASGLIRYSCVEDGKLV